MQNNPQNIIPNEKIKENKKANVPNLRFDDEPWNKVLLSKVCKVFDGTHQTPNYKNHGIKFVSVENISDLYNTDKFISEEDFNNNYKVYPRINDILMTRIGDIGTPAIVNRNEKLAYYVSLALLRPNNKINSQFLKAYIETRYFKRELWNRTIHVAFPIKINKEEIGKCYINFPNIKLQEKIANLIILFDKRIETQSKIIEDLELQIKWIKYKILSQIEQKELIPLSNVLVEFNEKSITNNEYPILSSTMNGIFIQSEYFNKQTASEKTIGYKKVPYGYCTYRSMSDTGEFRFNIQDLIDIGIVSPAYPVFTSKKYIIDFIAFYLNNSIYIKRQILKAKEGGTRFALSYSKLEKLLIPKIDKVQQNYIMTTLKTFIKKLNIEKVILNKLKEQKKYLLSNMFI